MPHGKPDHPRDVDGPEWLKEYRNGPKGVWLVASAARGKPAPIDHTYPHIHGLEVPGAKPVDGRIPRYSRRECLACAGADAPIKPREWVIPAEGDFAKPDGATRWRFACLLCRANGHADTEASAHGLLNLHLIEACPATAWSEAEFVERQLIRQVLVDLYPDDVPLYTKSYQPHPWFRH